MNIYRNDEQLGLIHRMMTGSTLGMAMTFSVWSHAVPTVPGDLEFSNEEWPAVVVTGANGIYTQTTNVAYAWQADMYLNPGWDTKVASWKVWPSVSNTQDLVPGKPVGPDLKSAGIGKNYPKKERPNEVSGTIGKTISTDLQPWSVGQCNDLVQYLKDAGLDESEIHGVDRHLAVEWQAHAAVSLYEPTPLLGEGFGASSAFSTPKQSTITCKSISPPPEVVSGVDIGLLPPEFELMDTDLSVFYTASSQCPKDILVASTTRTNIQGEFRLWYEIESANAGSLKSVDYTLGTGAAGNTGYVETPHMDTFQVPLTGLSGGGDGQTAGFESGTTDMLPGVGAGGSGTGSQQSAASDFNNAATTPANQHSGKIRAVAQRIETPQSNTPGGLAGELAAQTVASEWKNYSIVCEYDAQPAIDNLPTDMKVDIDEPYGQSASLPAVDDRLKNTAGDTGFDEDAYKKRVRLEWQDRKRLALKESDRRKSQAADKARRLQEEAEARRNALVDKQESARKNRLAAEREKRKKAQAKAKARAEAEAERKALIARQEQAKAKKMAAIEARSKKAAKKNNGRPRLTGKKPEHELKATLKRHANSN